VFFYQGVLDHGRGVDTALAAFAQAPPDKHVVFLGFGPKSETIQEFSKRHANIHFLPAVPPHELRDYTRSGDVGLCLIEPVCLSYVYCMPNKLFEYLGSGVPALVTELPELTEVVSSGQCGWTVPNDVRELARVVCSITRQEAAERGLRGVEWTTHNTWAKEREILRSVYDRLGFSGARASSSGAPRADLSVTAVADAK
jgi:glycosyltransferase involved in cell wall biosynthesis